VVVDERILLVLTARLDLLPLDHAAGAVVLHIVLGLGQQQRGLVVGGLGGCV